MKTSALLASAACLSLLAACTATPGGGTSSSGSSESSVMSSGQAHSFDSWQSYDNPQEDYSLQYPPTFSLETKKMTIVTQMTGAVIRYPKDFQTGTAFDEADIEITSEPRSCAPVTSIAQFGSGSQMTIGGITYDTQSGSDVGAGNLYQTYLYTTTQNGLCHRFALTIHSCNLGPDCGAGHTGALLTQPILQTFGQIMSTVTFSAAAGSASSSSVAAAAMNVSIGTPFTITLDSNPTTGFSWTASYDKAMFALDSSTYIAPASSMPGAGGREQFTFHGLKTGAADITLSYSRAWETNVPQAQTLHYAVTVK